MIVLMSRGVFSFVEFFSLVKMFHKNRADLPELKSNLIFLVNPAQIAPQRNIEIARESFREKKVQ